MRHRRAVVLPILLCLLAPACTNKQSTTYSVKRRDGFLRASLHAPREFTYTQTTGEETLEVRGRVRDDYTYQASVSRRGSLTYEEVDVDDSRWILVHDATLARAAAHDTALRDLVPGQWLSDSTGAPGEFRRASAPVRLLGGELVLEVVRALELPVYDSLFQKRIRQATKYDPDSVNYVERNDKFPPYLEDGVRFDVFPASYEPQLLFRNGIPNDLEQRLPTYFLFASFWYDGKHLTRVELFADIDVKRVTADIRAAAEGQGGAAGAGTPVDESLLPRVPQPFRATYTFRYPEEPLLVTAPAATGTVVLPVVATASGASDR